MTLTTKYEINDEVWFLHPLSQKAVIGRVRDIQLNVGSKAEYRTGDRRNLIKTGEYKQAGIFVVYTLDDHVRKEGCMKSERDLFPTKEALIESIKVKADNL